RADWSGGVAAAPMPALVGRGGIGGIQRAGNLRARPALPDDLSLSGGYARAARIPALAVAAAPAVFHLGELPQRVLSGVGGFGRALRRVPGTKRAHNAAVDRSGTLRGAVRGQSERLWCVPCSDRLPRQLPAIQAAGMGSEAALAAFPL